MKKKTSWKTLAGLTVAAVAFVRLSEDRPIDGIIIPPPGPPKLYPYGIGKYTSVKPPTCASFESAKYDEKQGRWYCVPRGLL